MNFLERLTLGNRLSMVVMVGGLLASLFVPMNVAIDPQMLGWVQGSISTILAFMISSGERQNEYWFKGKQDEPKE